MKRKNGKPRYSSYRFRLENLKQVYWMLLVIAKLLQFLAVWIQYFRG